MTLDDWLRAHEYLQPLARLRARIDQAIAAAAPPPAAPPDWNDYTQDFAAGTPLLRGEAAPDLQAGSAAIAGVVERLAAQPGDLEDDARGLHAWLRHEPNAATQTSAWLLGDDDWSPPYAGLLRCVGWLTLTASLQPLVAAFTAWRIEDRWLRRYCPTCGSLPAMAQLIGVDPGRQRFLVCGCCGTSWRFGRTNCPFCDVESPRLASLASEGEGGLRIDYCESCRGYLKTYNGRGHESFLLADWTSLHLDLAALDRGWRRAAVSLYELEATPARR